MDVFLIVRRKPTTVFVDVNKNILVHELNRMIVSTTKVGPENQLLYRDEQCMNANSTTSTAASQRPVLSLSRWTKLCSIS